MKHKKTECVAFLEGNLPCEDCDLEGHEAFCNWHRDWHNCECGAYDKNIEQDLSLKVIDVVEQPDGSAIVQLDVNEKFVTWFCNYKNIEKFNKDMFQEWFLGMLERYIQEQKNEIQK